MGSILFNLCLVLKGRYWQQFLEVMKSFFQELTSRQITDFSSSKFHKTFFVFFTKAVFGVTLNLLRGITFLCKCLVSLQLWPSCHYTEWIIVFWWNDILHTWSQKMIWVRRNLKTCVIWKQNTFHLNHLCGTSKYKMYQK